MPHVVASGASFSSYVEREPRRFFTSCRTFKSIPFIRNLIEYTKGDDDTDYGKLTALLHWKTESREITEADLDAIFNTVFGTNASWPVSGASVVDNVLAEAAKCLKADDGSNFENKIVLSIAIRIAAEQFMAEKINDPDYTKSITANQTAQLLEKYRSLPDADGDAVETIESVMLMTPENIHLNSFMYEPILDMSDDHLRKLYGEVLELRDGEGAGLEACVTDPK